MGFIIAGRSDAERTDASFEGRHFQLVLKRGATQASKSRAQNQGPVDDKTGESSAIVSDMDT